MKFWKSEEEKLVEYVMFETIESSMKQFCRLFKRTQFYCNLLIH